MAGGRPPVLQDRKVIEIGIEAQDANRLAQFDGAKSANARKILQYALNRPKLLKKMGLHPR